MRIRRAPLLGGDSCLSSACGLEISSVRGSQTGHPVPPEGTVELNGGPVYVWEAARAARDSSFPGLLSGLAAVGVLDADMGCGYTTCPDEMCGLSE